MKKSDLKNGALVELRNGNKCIKNDKALMSIQKEMGWLDLENYDENLTYKIIAGGIEYKRPNYDIVKVDNSNHLITNWSWKRQENILTDEEKAYLKVVIEPIKDKVDFIEKINCFFNQQQYVSINLDYDCIDLYCFEKNTQFKGMKLDREYTLKELGLE